MDNGPIEDDFRGLLLDDSQYFPLFLVESPDQLPKPLPDSDAFEPLPSPPVPPPSYEEHYPETIASNPFDLNGQGFLDFNGWTEQTEQTDQYYTSFFTQNPEHTPAVTPSVQNAILGVGRSSTDNHLQGRSSAVANGPSPIHDPVYFPPGYFPSPHSVLAPALSLPTGNFSPFVDGGEQFCFASGPHHHHHHHHHCQVHHTHTSLAQSSPISLDRMIRTSTVPQSPQAGAPRNRRNLRPNRSFTGYSPYPPTRTLSLPEHSISPKVTMFHICEWMDTDGNVCGVRITRNEVPEHFATAHNIKQMPHDRRLSCRWKGCQLRAGSNALNRESIVRHIREKHMGYRRASS